MVYLRQSHQEILKEEERRYRFLAEKHCGLTQSLLFLINKVYILFQVPLSMLQVYFKCAVNAFIQLASSALALYFRCLSS